MYYTPFLNALDVIFAILSYEFKLLIFFLFFFFLGEREQNVILWMDHRARKEADFINSTKHQVLKYVGGKISLEMETPKILWLKNNLPKETFWDRKGRFFDLPDFLTWKATDSVSRYVRQ